MKVYKLTDNQKPIPYELIDVHNDGVSVKTKDGTIEKVDARQILTSFDVETQVAQFIVNKTIELYYRELQGYEYLNCKKFAEIDGSVLDLAMKIRIVTKEKDMQLIHGRHRLINVAKEPKNSDYVKRLMNVELHTLSAVFDNGEILTVGFAFDLEKYNKEPFEYISTEFSELRNRIYSDKKQSSIEKYLDPNRFPMNKAEGVTFVYITTAMRDTLKEIVCSKETDSYLDEILAEIYQYSIWYRLYEHNEYF